MEAGRQEEGDGAGKWVIILIYQVEIWEEEEKQILYVVAWPNVLSMQPEEGTSPSGESCQVAANKAYRDILTLAQGAWRRGVPRSLSGALRAPQPTPGRDGARPSPTKTHLLPKCPPGVCVGRPTGKRISRLCDFSR